MLNLSLPEGVIPHLRETFLTRGPPLQRARAPAPLWWEAWDTKKKKNPYGGTISILLK